MQTWQPDGWPDEQEPGPPSDLPPGMADALTGLGAEVECHWREHARTYAFARAGSDRLFLRYSTDPGDAPAFQHEWLVRQLVGTEGPLRSPRVLASGESWVVERAIPREPVTGAVAIDAVAAAACRLMELRLPNGPTRSSARASRAIAARRAVRLTASPLPMRDIIRSRRLLEKTHLPLRQSHGDLHPGNLLFSEGRVWVVDWELTGARPAGFDLMLVWSLLPDRGDRDRLFEAAVDYLGDELRAGLERLRYAIYVRVLGGMFAAHEDFNRDPELARGMLPRLPEIRR